MLIVWHREILFYTFTGQTPVNMNNKTNFKNFFPTDNSSSTNLHYDIVASKLMVGIENHQKKSTCTNTSSISAIFYLIGTIIQLFVIVIVFAIGCLGFLYQYVTKPN